MIDSFRKLVAGIRRISPNTRYLLLLWLLSLFGLAPLLSPGYFYNAHDGRHSVFYQIMFDASLHDGAWWPRWAMHHAQGYGYPTFLLQAPLGFYLGEIFLLFGVGYTQAVKLSWMTGFLLSGWGMYVLVVEWGQESGVRSQESGVRSQESGVRSQQPAIRPGEGQLSTVHLIGVVAGVLYVYLPYRLVDVYVRAALNDTLLLAWFPWVFWAFDRLLRLGTAPGWVNRLSLAILTLGGALLTHTFALLSFAPLLVSFVLFRLIEGRGESRVKSQESEVRSQKSEVSLGRVRLDRRFWSQVLLAAVAGIGALLLSCAFLLPLLAEGRFLESKVYVSNTYDFRNHFVQVGQFFSSFWGYGYSDDPIGANDGMSFQLGALPMILVLIAGVWLIRSWIVRPTPHATRHSSLASYLFLALLFLLFLMTPLAQPLWEALPPLAVIQFPWRLLALAGFLACALAGVFLLKLNASDLSDRSDKSESLLLLPLLCLLVVAASATYSDPSLQAIEPWREDGRAIIEFEQQHPDMMPYTIWSQEKFTQSPMTADYLAEGYQEEHGFTTSLTRVSIRQGKGEILSQSSGGSSGGGVVRMDEAGVVRVHLQNFPGWRVRLDGLPVDWRVSEPEGLIELEVPAGEHRLEVRMGSTPIRLLGALISWTVVLGLVGGIIITKLAKLRVYKNQKVW